MEIVDVGRNLDAIGVQPADCLIEPDVTGFELSSFGRAAEIALAGEEAAMQALPAIKASLLRLDPQLFAHLADAADSSS